MVGTRVSFALARRVGDAMLGAGPAVAEDSSFWPLMRAGGK
jgi:hypothetical protein